MRMPTLLPAIVLDLDNTVRRSASGADFIQGLADIELFPDVEAILWDYRNRDFLIYGVTNQGGIAYGYRSEEDVEREIEYTCQLFESDPFHGIFYSSCHPDGTVEPYNRRSLLRKPDYGMLVLCEMSALGGGFFIDWDNSLVVGDRWEDIRAANAAQVPFQFAWQFFGRPEPPKQDKKPPYKGRNRNA